MAKPIKKKEKGVEFQADEAVDQMINEPEMAMKAHQPKKDLNKSDIMKHPKFHKFQGER